MILDSRSFDGVQRAKKPKTQVTKTQVIRADHPGNSFLANFDTITRRYGYAPILIGSWILLMASLLGASLVDVLPKNQAPLYLGLLFFSLFSGILLHHYLLLRRPWSLEKLVKTLVREGNSPATIDDFEHHLFLAQECTFYCERLEGRELSPALRQHQTESRHIRGRLSKIFLQPILQSTWIRRWNHWCHYPTRLHLQRLLLQTALENYLNLLKKEPLNPATHEYLAKGYVSLSTLYQNNERAGSEEKRKDEQIHRHLLRQAVEEWKVVANFTPEDHHIYERLAELYRDLGLTQEETASREQLMKFHPEHVENCLRLGILYFITERRREGLDLYQQLLNTSPSTAKQLIDYYGTAFITPIPSTPTHSSGRADDEIVTTHTIQKQSHI